MKYRKIKIILIIAMPIIVFLSLFRIESDIQDIFTIGVSENKVVGSIETSWHFIGEHGFRGYDDIQFEREYDALTLTIYESYFPRTMIQGIKRKLRESDSEDWSEGIDQFREHDQTRYFPEEESMMVAKVFVLDGDFKGVNKIYLKQGNEKKLVWTSNLNKP